MVEKFSRFLTPILSKKLFILGFLFSFFLISSCGLMTTKPKLEMSLANAAFMAAKKSNATKLSPGYYRKAEYYILKAKSAYKRKYFNKAKQYAILSKKFSEKAEFLAIKKAALENL